MNASIHDITQTRPKIYLAGPMSGIRDFNFPVFFDAADFLEQQGFEVFNPAQADLDKWGDLDGVARHANYRDCLKTDLTWICDNAVGIALLPGWEWSKGSLAEKALAEALGIDIFYLQYASGGRWYYDIVAQHTPEFYEETHQT